jgi:hypothetical protein
MAFTTNALQKRQSAPTIKDIKVLNKALKECKDNPEVSVRIRPMPDDCAVVVWHDSALYNSIGEEITDEAELHKQETHKVYSQAGQLVGLVSQQEMKVLKPARVSILDWRTRATRRVVVSTFAAETASALEGLGIGLHMRALLCEIRYGVGPDGLLSFDESQLPLKLITDCKSLYDHVLKDSSIPDDRWTAIYVAALKCGVSAGPGRDIERSELMWVPSRCMLADGLTKSGLSGIFRIVLKEATAQFHELSAQAIKRLKVKEDLYKCESGLV